MPLSSSWARVLPEGVGVGRTIELSSPLSGVGTTPRDTFADPALLAVEFMADDRQFPAGGDGMIGV